MCNNDAIIWAIMMEINQLAAIYEIVLLWKANNMCSNDAIICAIMMEGNQLAAIYEVVLRINQNKKIMN